jgi:hypothetical protein
VLQNVAGLLQLLDEVPQGLGIEFLDHLGGGLPASLVEAVEHAEDFPLTAQHRLDRCLEEHADIVERVHVEGATGGHQGGAVLHTDGHEAMAARKGQGYFGHEGDIEFVVGQ